MKTKIITLVIATLTMTSCLKKRTCTCKTPSGTVVSQTTTKTNKQGIKDFEAKCKANRYEEKTNGVVISSTPCELS